MWLSPGSHHEDLKTKHTHTHTHTEVRWKSVRGLVRLLPAGPRSVTLHGGNSRPAGNQHACQDCLQWGRNVPGLPPRGQVSPSQISCTPDTRVALGGLGEEGDGATEESALVRSHPPWSRTRVYKVTDLHPDRNARIIGIAVRAHTLP